ncbi:hypothetical protein OESDEN_19861, partial [Oesophagostomum dentatum]
MPQVFPHKMCSETAATSSISGARELFPIGNGRYRIQSRTEETTAPPKGLPYPPPEVLQNLQEVRPQEPTKPEAASRQGATEVGEQTREETERQPARVIEPAKPRSEKTESQERIAAEIHQKPRDMTREEAYARVEPVAAPRTEPGRQHEGYYNYYDEIWYEPAGQRTYPRLLFSPRHGWREMTEDEILRIRSIRPISEFDPALAITESPFPANHYHRHQSNPEMEDYPVQGAGYQQPDQQSSADVQVSAYRYNPGAHPQTATPEANVEVTLQNRVQG